MHLPRLCRISLSNGQWFFFSSGIGGNLYIQLKLVLSTVQLFRPRILKTLLTKYLAMFTAELERFSNTVSMKFWSYIIRYIFLPSHLQLEVFVTELSLDMLLFMLGKLEVAGPFSVKTSVILSNCCKVILSLITVHCFCSFCGFFP